MNSRVLNIFLILIGTIVAIYAQAEEDQNTYVLVGGIFVLMTGLYRLSRSIPSREEQEEHSNNEDDL